MPVAPDSNAQGVLEQIGTIIWSPEDKQVICEVSRPRPETVTHEKLELSDPDRHLAMANGRRLVAAWNAVRGIPTEALESGAIAMMWAEYGDWFVAALNDPERKAARRAER